MCISSCSIRTIIRLPYQEYLASFSFGDKLFFPKSWRYLIKDPGTTPTVAHIKCTLKSCDQKPDPGSWIFQCWLFPREQFIISPSFVCAELLVWSVAGSRKKVHGHPRPCASVHPANLGHAAATVQQEIKGWEGRERKGEISWLVKTEASVKCCAWKPVRPH